MQPSRTIVEGFAPADGQKGVSQSSLPSRGVGLGWSRTLGFHPKGHGFKSRTPYLPMLFEQAIENLKEGNLARIRPKGNSMVPRIHSGDTVILEPITDLGNLRRNQIVLARVKGNILLHKISAIERRGNSVYRFQISNNHGRVNGWASEVYGRVLRVYSSSQEEEGKLVVSSGE